MAENKAKEFIKKVGDGAADAANSIKDKAAEIASNTSQNASEGFQKLQESFYRPVTLEQFRSLDFQLPKLVFIADNGDRAKVKVMDGAIGWMSIEEGLSTLHLYEKAIDDSGISFFPHAECFSGYYADKFGERYVNLDRFFDIMQEEKRAELLDIAYSLGATSCTIETYEFAKRVKIGRGKSERNEKKKKGQADVDITLTREGELSAEALRSVEKKTSITQTFKGSTTPVEPELKWLKDDPQIRQLVKARCDYESDNRINEHHMTISNKTLASISASTAMKISEILDDPEADSNFNFYGEFKQEQRQFFKVDMVFSE